MRLDDRTRSSGECYEESALIANIGNQCRFHTDVNSGSSQLRDRSECMFRMLAGTAEMTARKEISKMMRMNADHNDDYGDNSPSCDRSDRYACIMESTADDKLAELPHLQACVSDADAVQY